MKPLFLHMGAGPAFRRENGSVLRPTGENAATFQTERRLFRRAVRLRVPRE